MEEKKVTLCIVTAAYNESAVLPEFVARVTEALKGTRLVWELILVDDGSQDATWDIIRLASAKDNRVRGFRLSRNFGHQKALVVGLQAAHGDFVCTMDADLQDPPELIPEMLEYLLKNNLDLVYGQRSSREGVSLLLKCCYSCFYRLLGWVSGVHIPKDTGDFRIARKELVDLVVSMPDTHDFLRGAFAWLGFKQEPFFYERKGRRAGKSSYTLSKLMDLAINGLWGFSLKPLRLAILLAFGLAAAATSLAAYIVLSLLYGVEAPSGWASLAVVILLTGSANLLALGTVAEYIGQVLKQTRRRPTAIVAEMI